MTAHRIADHVTPRDWPAGRQLAGLLLLLLLAGIAALFLRAWLQLQLEESGHPRWQARNLSYLIVPALLLFMLIPVWRPRLAVLRRQFAPSILSWKLVAIASGIGISLRLAYWGVLTTRAAFASVAGTAVDTGPSIGFNCPATGDILLHLLVMGCLLPLTEEVMFRGWIAEWLAQFRRWIPVVLSASLFTVFHLPGSRITVFAFGLLAAIAYLRSGSLWPTLIMHAAFNSLIVLDWFCLQVVWNPVEKTAVVAGVGLVGALFAVAGFALATWLVVTQVTGPEPGDRTA